MPGVFLQPEQNAMSKKRKATAEDEEGKPESAYSQQINDPTPGQRYSQVGTGLGHERHKRLKRSSADR